MGIRMARVWGRGTSYHAPSAQRQHDVTCLSAFAALVLLAVALPACEPRMSGTIGSAHSTPRPDASAQSTATQADLLAWRAIATPPHYQPPDGGGGGDVIAVAPGDGATAFVCTVADVEHGSPPQPWVTHDAGASWQPLAVPMGVQPAYGCGISPDALDPRVAILAAVSSRTTPYSSGYALLTLDGGLTWQPYHTWPAGASSQPPAELETATLGGTTYQLRQAQSGPDLVAHLAVSIDHLTTWHNIDGPVIAAHEQPFHFWVDQSTGGLLLEATVLGSTTFHLWSSGDQGQHWKRITAPSIDDVAVQTATQSPSWHICIQSGASAPAFNCTSDGGSSWVALPPLPPSLASPRLVALTDDGAVLMRAGDQSARSVLYRLASGSGQWRSQWQSLGAAPQSFVVYASGSGGVLWAEPLNGDVVDGDRATYIASYPG